jgi:hypothetical protein
MIRKQQDSFQLSKVSKQEKEKNFFHSQLMVSIRKSLKVKEIQ